MVYISIDIYILLLSILYMYISSYIIFIFSRYHLYYFVCIIPWHLFYDVCCCAVLCFLLCCLSVCLYVLLSVSLSPQPTVTRQQQQILSQQAQPAYSSISFFMMCLCVVLFCVQLHLYVILFLYIHCIYKDYSLRL